MLCELLIVLLIAQTPIAFGTTNNDDCLLVGTVNGDVLCLDSESGIVNWTFNTGSSLIDYNFKKLESEDVLFLPSISGSKNNRIYSVQTDTGRIQSHQFNLRNLVYSSPFQQGDLLYLGSKNTKIFILDSSSGEILSSFSTSNDLGECPSLNDISREGVVIVGRADYTIRAFDINTGIQAWNLSSGEYFYSLKDIMGDMLQENREDNLISSDKGPTLQYYSNGVIECLDSASFNSKWKIQIDSHAISAYTNQNTFNLIHPSTSLNNEDVYSVLLDQLHDSRFIVLENPKVSNSKTLLLPYPNEDNNNNNDEDTIDNNNNNDIILNNILFNKQQCSGELCKYLGIHVPDNSAALIAMPIEIPLLVNASENTTPFVENSTIPTPSITVDVSNTSNMHLLLYFSLLVSLVLLGLLLYKNIVAKASNPITNNNNNTVSLNSKSKKKKKTVKNKVNNNASETEQITTRNNVLVRGKLTIHLDKILGFGSCGTIVYEGYLDGRIVAVKRMLFEFYKLAQREIDLLIESDIHPNLISYYLKEEDSEFIYLALTYCPKTLAYSCEEDYNSLDQLQVLNILKGLVNGVHHLHSLNIIHTDIKPQNILLDMKNTVKISDMGLAKKLEVNQSSMSDNGSGSYGWQAPEILHNKSSISPDLKKIKITKKVDIWSLGCLMYYVLSNAEHPFGDKLEREINITKSFYSLDAIKSYPEASHLIESMIQHDPHRRPNIDEVCSHCLFWSDSQKLLFLKDASDRIESEKNSSLIIQNLEANAASVLGTDWSTMIDPRILDNLGKYRKYDFSKISDLLRLIRNKSHHYRDLPEEVRLTVIGPPPSQFLCYFEEKFPLLFIHVYNVIHNYCKNEDSFRHYFVHVK